MKNKKQSQEYSKNYYQNHKDKWKVYYELNKDKIFSEESKKRRLEYSRKHKIKNKESLKKYRKNNKEYLENYVKNYHEINKDKINKKKRERWKKNMISNSFLKLKGNIKSLIKNSFKSNSTDKTLKTAQILGCSFFEFKLYIESKFESWMTWNNYGMYKLGKERTWNLDHINPLSKATTKEDLIALNHYTNLRPLCSKENRSKWDNFLNVN